RHSPDQIDGEGEDRVADIFAKQRHQISRHVKDRVRREHQIEEWDQDREGREHREEDHRAAVEDAQQRRHHASKRRHHVSTARPLSANSPRGRFWMNRMMNTRIAILASTAPANGSRNLLATPSVKAATRVPQRLPTPPNTTTRNESMM